MQKIKRILKMLSPIAVLTPCVLASISCTSRFEQEEREKLRIVTFYSNDVEKKRYKALVEIIDSYNKYVDENQSKNSELMKIEPYVLGKNHEEMISKLRLGLSNKDSSNLGNLILAYPSVAVAIAEYDMSLDFNNSTKNIYDKYTSINKNLLGLDPNKKWVLPFGRSTEIMTIDKLALAHIIKQIDQYNKKINNKSIISTENAKKINEAITQYDSNSTDEKERNFIENYWKITEQSIQKHWNSFDLSYLDDSILDSYDSLYKFSQFVSLLLNESNAQNDVYTLGFDNPISELYMQLFNESGNNWDEYFLKPDKNNSVKLDYKKILNDKTSKEHKIFKSKLSQLLNIINTGRMYTQYSNDYFNSVRIQKDHKILFAISSSRAINYYKYAPNFSLTYKQQNISYLADNGNGLKYQDNNIIWESGKYKKVVLTNDHITNNQRNKIIQFAKDAKDIQVLYNGANAFELFKKNKNDLMKVYINTEYDKKAKKMLPLTPEQIKKIDEVDLNVSDVATYKQMVEEEKKLAKNKYEIIYLIKNIEKTTENYKKLNDNETFVTTTPKYKEKSKDVRGTYFVQGPSLMAMHANQKQNKATQHFVQWLYEHKTNYDKYIATPVERFASQSEYIFPSDNFGKLYKDKHVKNNVFNDIQIENQKSDMLPFEEPVDTSSQIFREAIEVNLNLAIKDSYKKDNQLTIDQLIMNIKNKIK
ncbi:P68 family surface lipoprotein [Mycoplasma phocoenae]|uniref:Mycoplasma lipoprotein C-terminal domain-containing protein n=1 Tax=Mycoplasma phocoenae TaxID=754517 RepID=A0A858U652_9MOLU|nr:hypothetical protein [Mycoplasma phocoenae]QJG66927.1 hypothetical protein HGG69_01135 [Mycoplasma phocoenae]